MNITRFSIQRPVGISMIVAFFVVLGLYSFYRIGVELLPDVNTPYVTVRVKYPGASAESVEQEIVRQEQAGLKEDPGQAPPLLYVADEVVAQQEEGQGPPHHEARPDPGGQASIGAHGSPSSFRHRRR